MSIKIALKNTKFNRQEKNSKKSKINDFPLPIPYNYATINGETRYQIINSLLPNRSI